MPRMLPAFVMAMLWTATAQAALAQQAARRTGASHLDRFDGWVALGAGDSVRVSVKTWAIPGDTTLASLVLPERGTSVVQVRAGRLSTIVGGKRQFRSEGEFFTVAEGERLGVVTGDDEAVLQTVHVGGP
jgi:hypothetical protein